LLRDSKLPTLLLPEGILVLEVAQNWRLPDGTVWECLRRKRYGSTETLFLKCADGNQPST
jgi:16S rRNA G966 N2-methylase RsmD